MPPTVKQAPIEKKAPTEDRSHDQDAQNEKVDKEADSEESEEEPAEKPREKIVRVDQIWDKKIRKFRFVKTAKPKNRKEKFGRYVVTVARRISERGVFTGAYVVDIRGNFLCEALADIYRDVDGVNFPKNVSLDNDELKLLFHARFGLVQKLEEVKSSKNSSALQTFELEAGVEFIHEHFGYVFHELKQLPKNEITFSNLWTLFPPNTLVYGTDPLKQDRIYRVKGSRYKEEPDGSTNFILSIDYLDSDGELTGFLRNIACKIAAFEGSMIITNLSLYPFALHPEHEALKNDLVVRGEKLLRLRGRHLQEYSGHAITEEGKKFNSHGRVMLDPVIFDQLQPNNTLVPRVFKPMRREVLTAEHKIMLNPVLYGFSLGDKTWGAFAVSSLEDIVWNDNIINSLVLPQEQKGFIHCLVKSHGLGDANGFDDIVRDKGKGLIGLLAGPPGVGKTLTAEVMAEIAHRPLYMISSGELGDTSTTVQNKLGAILELAETWNAVLLLDEADVFLAKRDNTNLARNAITSIFLRHLEYYQGILLLTTNRGSGFDPAFQSRIHFSFQYKDLEVEARKAIWRTFLGKAESGNVDVAVGEDDIDVLSEIVLNGRQIKNIMSISQAVALEKNVPLDLRGIRLAHGFSQMAIE
ncbi:hypothetical protein DL95DRAFT_329576 [Leptodontidium sp. 2 PMI_412]|nr:hypothetical protein DL95DRAFT_329576 [Leptodontidium sp. 2 PMI_412]